MTAQDIFIYNHHRKTWNRIEDDYDKFSMIDIRKMLRGGIIERDSGAMYKIDTAEPA